MNVTLNNLRGIDDAIVSLYQSKGNHTAEKELSIRKLVHESVDWRGFIKPERSEEFDSLLKKVIKYGKMHTTILRYIDFSFTFDGLHRGAQDDLDAHAHRFNNRIIRRSTRLSSFDGAVSDYYKNTILSLNDALYIISAEYDISIPDTLTVNGDTYIRDTNGYVNKTYIDAHPDEEQDVRRGLYNLAIPSSCIVKCDLFEYSHVYKMRNKSSHAHPELRDGIESLTSQLAEAFYMFDDEFRELLNSIMN